jgi:phosphinothricin acetyltransferase
MSPAAPSLSSVTIRDAVRDDCGAISDIYNHYVSRETCTWALEPETLDERLAWFDHHGPQHPVYVAEAGAAIVGWGSLSVYNPRGGYARTVENSVYIDHRWRRRGVGGALLGRLIEVARRLGHHTIIAGISTEQAASVALHARHGFVETGRLREAGFKHGQWLDVMYMQLMLAPAAPG